MSKSMAKSMTDEKITENAEPGDKEFARYLASAVAVFTVGLVWGLFTIAGRWDWLAGWSYLAVLYAGNISSHVYLWYTNPNVLRWRARYGKGTKNWDKVCLAAFGVTFLLILVVAAFDSGRYHWAPMPIKLWSFGAALFVFGQGLITWSMRVNPFFEKTARIQTDRNHKVITSGPYRYVRHPGYVGTIAGYALAPPLLLGSWWAFLPAFLSALSLIVRTVLEDRMLQNELDGYTAYAQRVRYRLVPNLW